MTVRGALAAAVGVVLTALCLQRYLIAPGAIAVEPLSVRAVLQRASKLTSVLGRPVKAKILASDQHATLVQIDGALTDQQCDEMVALVNGTLHASTMHATTPGRNLWGIAHNPEAWSRRCTEGCADREIISTLSAVTEALVVRPVQHLEPYQLLHYQVGQEYKRHHDFIWQQSQMEMGPREFTVFYYLNDVTEGGETHFPVLRASVTPRRGRAVIWPNVQYDDRARLNPSTHHTAMPVLQGAKFGATQWIHEHAYDDFATT